jgi:PAS domain-containing protein
MEERRRETPAGDLSGYLRALPALLLLDRLPTAILGVALAGTIGYANPACADMLGYADAGLVTRLRLPELLAGLSHRSPSECVGTLRSAESIVSWNHAQGHVVRTTVSPPLLMRKSDPLLLISMLDVTDWLWAARST